MGQRISVGGKGVCMLWQGKYGAQGYLWGRRVIYWKQSGIYWRERGISGVPLGSL